jgi:hypothetical protein
LFSEGALGAGLANRALLKIIRRSALFSKRFSCLLFLQPD